jgi:hypothetical protein
MLGLVGTALVVLDFPVDARVWGTVAEWAAAAGTGGAAIAAAWYYIREHQRLRRAQAELVQVQQLSRANQKFSIEVHNRSDRAISGFNVYYKEKKLVGTLLRNQFITLDRSNDPMSSPGDSTIAFLDTKTHRKDHIIGFDGREGLITFEAPSLTIEPGGKIALIGHDQTIGGTHIFRASTAYWLIFADANNMTWEREIVIGSHGYGKLREARRKDYVPNTFERQNWLGRATTKLSRYFRVLFWLVKHFRESTQKPG